MKRMLSLLLLAALAFALCACGRQPAEAATASAESETAAAEPEAVPAEDPAPEAGAVSAETAAPAVYFTSDISPEGLRAVYEALNWSPSGRLAVKVSTGEPPASNYLRAELIGPLV